MNTDKPTPAPQDSTPAEPATVDESAEPTVALSESGDLGDSEPTVTLQAAETAEPTADLSFSAGSEPTADLSAVPPAETASEGDESEPTVALPADEVAEATVVLPAGEKAALPVAEVAEETVALPVAEVAEVAEIAEETVALPVDEVAEETVALSVGEVAAAAAADEGETTTVISAGSEPTIALPKPRLSPESKVALPVSRASSPAPEPTIALPIPPTAPRPAPESPATRPHVPAPRTAPTVTPPPAEPTIALPAAPGAPAVVPPRLKPLTRRRLLMAIPAVAGTALIGGTIAALAGRGEPEAGSKAPNLVVSEPAPAQSPTPTAPEPTTPVMKVPVHTLQDFRKMVPGDPFPADAIALTIDDGPHPVWTPKILRLLEKHDVPALFCMIGNQVRGHEPTARDVAADGHQLANHTWSHPIDLAELPSHAMIKEIHRAQDKIYSTTGVTPSLFRAPGGAWSKGLSESVSQSNVIPMDWTADPRDWARPGVAHITSRLLAAGPGQILLCHDGGGDRSQTLASLKTVIPALQARGLKFVALT
jgi:peptidoglycan/xylan/chitin deacetylase (PgdA/CDA1 family)